MEAYEIFALALGLAMDAFAVAVCKGLAMKKVTLKNAAAVGLWFGGFQGLMPLLGFLLGFAVAGYVDAFDQWIAFFLLAFIGGGMIKEGMSREDKEDSADASLKLFPMLTMAVATSIDALAVGVTFAFKDVNVFFASAVIAAVTFAVSAAGVKVGSIFGSRYKSAAELAGGFILIVLGIKMVLSG